MVAGWWMLVGCGLIGGWMAWVYFWGVVAPRRGWYRGEAWRPRVAAVQIALDACAGAFRGRRCVKCGSMEVRTEQSGLWDGYDASGARVGGIFWYGECEACGCRLASDDDDEPAREAEEEEWDQFMRAPWAAEARRLQGRGAWPGTVKEAVRRLMEEISGEQRDLVRGTPAEEDLAELHFDVGLSIRNEFGLWGGNRRLLADCGTDPEDGAGADHASGVILRALRARLIETASAAGMERARGRWRAHEAERERRRDEEAKRDEAITSRRCRGCGRACPRYRRTCKYCGVWMGREVG